MQDVPLLRRCALAAALLVSACVTPGEPVTTISRPLPEADAAIFLAVVPQSDRTRPSMGSAFLVTPTLLVTNRNVVDGAHQGRVLLTNRGRAAPLEGRVIWVSPDRYNRADLAVIELATPLNDVRPLALAAAPAVGQRVVTAGFPWRPDYPTWILAMTAEGLPIDGGPPARRLGTVLAQPSDPNNRWFETSPSGFAGIAGGPVLDACDRVVGIATYHPSAGGGPARAQAQLPSGIEQEVNRLRPSAVPLDASP